MSVSAHIFSKCIPAISSDIARCGGVTLCSISPTTEDELASIYSDGSSRRRIIGALIEADFMGKSCNVQQQGMYDFLRSTTVELGTKKLGFTPRGDGIIDVNPFVKMRVKDPINSEYWAWTTGSTTPGTVDGVAYTFSGLATSAGGIPIDINWFPVGLRVFIEGKSAAGSATHTAYKVVARAAAAGGVTLYCTSLNSASNLAADKLEAPVTGLLVRGTPNVNDHESYCGQIPGLNTNRNQPFWVETTRYSMCQDDLVDKYVNLIKDNNPLYKEFEHVEQVELNKQIITDFQKRHAWAFFYNKPLPYQNMTEWDSLEEINTATLSGDLSDLEGRCVGRRAAATGIVELLAECDRVSDLQGGTLNLYEVFEDMFAMQQIRESIGSPMADVFEWWLPSRFVPTVEEAFIRYYKEKTIDTIRFNQDLKPGMQQAAFGFQFKEFNIDFPSVKVRLVTHRALDHMYDRRRAVSSALETTGRFIWIFDWSTIYQGVIGSNSVTNRTGDIGQIAAVDDSALCVMKFPKKSQKLVSVTYTNVIECAKANRIYENVGATVPEYRSGSSDQDYTDYKGTA